jgi:serine/threonine-protein kinase
VEQGTTFAGRWVIERPLSSGGMGDVYVAVHADTGRKVALKVIKSEKAHDADLVARFRTETGALAAVSHPNVVTFLDSGVEGEQFFLVMELLAGKPLRSIMTAPVEPKRALRIAADVCRALAAIHAQGIVHRDLKPENVFLVDAVGHDEIAKLIDFGIARLESAGPRSTMTGNVVGTPGYISPEQLRAEPATTSSDVYAVGVILYELVTGKFPFNAQSTQAMLVKQLVDPLVPARDIASTLPAHVDALIARFLERDPALRPSSATAALSEITNAIAALSSSLPPGAMTEDVSGPSLRAIADASAASLANAPTPAPTTVRPLSSTPMPVPAHATSATGVAPAFTPPPLATTTSVRGRNLVIIAATVVVVALAATWAIARASGARGADAAAARRGAGPFFGNYNALYTGKYALGGDPRAGEMRAVSSGIAHIEAGPSSDMLITIELGGGFHGTCHASMQRDIHRAFSDPPQQPCTFLTPDGATQTNTTSVKAVLRGETVTLDVDGTFEGTTALHIVYSGTFHGTWTLTRR